MLRLDKLILPFKHENRKLKRENIKGKQKANKTHFEVGKKVRQAIEELGGTMPEELPTERSIKKIETSKQRALKKNNKKN